MSYLTIIPFILFISSYITELSVIETPVEKMDPVIELKNTFKKDLLESIMEFADDSLAADGLYIPEWLITEGGVPSPKLD